MTAVRIPRRALLKTVGSAAAALPLYHLLASADAHAQAGGPPLRFLAVFTPQGTWHDSWRPKGGELDFNVNFPNSILAPLDPPTGKSFRSRMLVLDGLDYRVLYEKEDSGHAGGINTFLTGTRLAQARAQGPSLDQYLGERIPAAAGGRRTVNLGVKTQWLVGDEFGTIAFGPGGGRIFHDDSPLDVFQRLFAGKLGTPDEVQRALARKRSVLDFLVKDLTRLQRRLTGQERQKLEQHLTALRDIERRLASGGGCTPNGAPPSSIDYARPDPADIPAICKLQADLIAQIFACDLTRVATLQILSAGDHYEMPWLNFNPEAYQLGPNAGVDPHGDVAHAVGPENPTAIADLSRMQRWFTEQIVYLMERLDSIPEGDGTVLDHTIILWGNELGQPSEHSNLDVPFVLLGGANQKLRMGRYLRYSRNAKPDCPNNVCTTQTAHNALLVSICRAFGLDQNTFGDPDYAGALPNLT